MAENKFVITKKEKVYPKIDPGSRTDVALKLIESGKCLLDVGCGCGTFGFFAKEKYPLVYGIDVSESAVKDSERNGIIACVCDLDRENMPFSNNFFDAVVCLDVMEHVLDPHKLLDEVHRALKPGGIFVISTPNISEVRKLATLSIFDHFPETSNDKSRYDGGHLHYFTYTDVRNLLLFHGFDVIGEYGVFGINFLLRFLSPGVVIKARKRKR